jgi:3-oxoadipate enol-lactonase
MATVTTPLGAIGYESAGDGADQAGAVPLVLLHGVGSDRSAWRGQLERFGDERRTVAFDLPGYGESEFIAGAGHDAFAAAMLAGMDALGIGVAHVCGLSLGGVVAIAMHAAASERCASLTLADSFAWHPGGRAILDRSLAAVDALGMAGLAEARVDALIAQPADPAVRAEVVATMARIDPAAYRLAAHAVWLADQRQRVGAIRCPTLIMVGAEDAITPSPLSDDLKDRMPHAALVEISRAGHLSNLEQPETFDRVLAMFLDGAGST